MGGDLQIDWRTPDALRKAGRARTVPAFMRMSLRAVVATGVLLAVAWLVQRQWLPDLEFPWVRAALGVLALAALPAVAAFGYGFVRYRYRLTDELVGNRDENGGMCAWANAVGFKVQPAPEAPGVDLLCIYTQRELGYSTPFWAWLSQVEPEAEWSWTQIPLPEDAELARRIVAEAERRVPRMADLDVARREEVEAKLARMHEGSGVVVTSWADAVVVLLGAMVIGTLAGALLRSGALPSFGDARLWLLLMLSPVAVIGPGSWLTLYHHGRAGFARFRVRLEVFVANTAAVMVAFMTAIIAAAFFGAMAMGT